MRTGRGVSPAREVLLPAADTRAAFWLRTE